MNRRQIPVVITLTAGALSMIFSMIRNESMIRRSITLLVVVIVFYLVSRFFQWVLDYFDAQNEKLKQQEGEMVEKDPSAAEADTATQQSE